MSNYNTIQLRAHHGMCLSFYQGKGYSQEFVDNMNDIAAKLKENPTIEIISSCDQLCCCCPNQHIIRDTDSDNDCNTSSRPLCQTESLVASWDQMVMDACGFTLSDKISYDDFHTAISDKILSTPIFDSICGDCQWSSLCHVTPKYKTTL